MSARKKRRGVTVGTVAALILSMAVIIGMGFVLVRVTGNVKADIRKSPDRPAAAAASLTQAPSAGTEAPAKRTTAPTAIPTRVPGGTFTLTAGGTVALEKNVRQSGYDKASGTYDFSGVLSGIRGELPADLTLATLENLVIPSSGVSDLNAPAEVMDLLVQGGFDLAAIGFRRSFESGSDGIRTTWLAAQGAEMNLFGAYQTAAEAAPAARIQEINGVRVATLHFTETLTTKSATSLKKDGRTALIPRLSDAPAQIARAREAGAEVVIVSVHWGTENKTSPTSSQRETAQKLADAGADVILGTGTRRVQTVEWLRRAGENGASNVLCAYSLGCLVADSTKEGQTAGVLLSMQITTREDGSVQIRSVRYMPTYRWRHKENGSVRYSVIPADREAPEGMSASERKALNKAFSLINGILDSSAATLR